MATPATTPATTAAPTGQNASFAGITSTAGEDFPVNQPFLLVAYPGDVGAWKSEEVDGVQVWLPQLTPLIIREGTNGFKSLAAGEPDVSKKTAKAFEIIKNRGGILIDVEAPLPDAVLPAYAPRGASAVRTASVKGGGLHWHLVWDQPRPKLRDGTFAPKHHRESYNRFLAWLVASGAVPQITDVVREGSIAQADRRARVVRTNAASEPDMNRRQERTAKVEGKLAKASDAVSVHPHVDKAGVFAKPKADKPKADKAPAGGESGSGA